MVGLSQEAEQLAKKIEDEFVNGRSTMKRRREMFGEFANLRNRIEESDDKGSLEVLDTKRKLLGAPKQAQSLTAKVSMYFRFLLTIVACLWGAFCCMLLVPLRLTHPFLRKLGVPNGWLPMDALTSLWSSTVLAAAGVKANVEGGSTEWLDRTDLVGIVIYNHTSNLDPFIVNSICHAHAPKYVGKKDLFMIPVLGWLFAMCGMVPINRGDPEKARATMNERVSGIMKMWGRNVAISPEGTRSKDGHLSLPFKKGVYHLQDLTKVPLKPVVIKGAYELWPRGRLFTAPGEVTVSFLPPQWQVDSDKNVTRLKTQKDYADAIAKHAEEKHASPLSFSGFVGCVCQLLVSSAFYAVVTWLFSAVFKAVSLGALYNSIVLAVITVFVSFYIHKYA